MKKLIFIPKNYNEAIQLKDYYDGVILSMDNLSINYPVFTMDEIIDLTQKLNDKEIFINLNKNMHNSDIDNLKQTINILEKLNIKGILFYDLSIPNIKPNIDLVWSQCHMTTNKETCNYWYKRGVKYTFLSNEITLNEIKEIKENTNSELMIQVFGYIPIFTSKRNLVKNYKKTFNLKENSKINYIKHENDLYPIVDDKQTVVYNKNIQNLIEELKQLENININYFIINSFEIENIKEVLENFKNGKIFKIDNEGKGFLYEETIYKVKKWRNQNY